MLYASHMRVVRFVARSGRACTSLFTFRAELRTDCLSLTVGVPHGMVPTWTRHHDEVRAAKECTAMLAWVSLRAGSTSNRVSLVRQTPAAPSLPP
jgi:hypothetical protein